MISDRINILFKNRPNLAYLSLMKINVYEICALVSMVQISKNNLYINKKIM